MTLTEIIIVGLVAYRLTRALVEDSITDPVRGALYAWAWEGPRDRPRLRGRLRGWTYELATCAHCVGFWVSLVVVTVYSAVDPEPVSGFVEWGLAVLAAAGLQSLLASITGRLDAA